MSWIKEIDIKDAKGLLKRQYDGIEKSRGKLSNIMRVQSLDPLSMGSHLKLYHSIMFGNDMLSRSERELVAVFVSLTNQCLYCIKHHAEALRAYRKDVDRIIEGWQNPQSIDLTERELAMVEYATKLTRTPSLITELDIEPLNKAGLKDREILNLNMVVSYFNFVNRIALGLGVEFTEDELKGYHF